MMTLKGKNERKRRRSISLDVNESVILTLKGNLFFHSEDLPQFQ